MTGTKVISVEVIQAAVRQLAQAVNSHLPADVSSALTDAAATEPSPLGQYALEQICDNARLAAADEVPMCQDTGLVVVFLDLGQDLRLIGGEAEKAIQAGIAEGYQAAYCRASMVEEPVFDRKNTGNNLPAVLHWRLVPGDRLTITLMPKGGGAENMGALGLLKPTQGEEGVYRFVMEAVRRAGGNPCPPITVGVGIGGSMEKATLLAKEALLEPVEAAHPDLRYAALENRLLTDINQLGIGPQGFGGATTALAVHIKTFPAHIAMLPVAVNLNCHAVRHASVTLEGVADHD